MTTLAQKLTDLVRQAAVDAGFDPSAAPLEPAVPTNNPENGDYQSNFAFRLGKALKTNPRAVAEKIAHAIPTDDLVAFAEVAGPGFINFRLRDLALGRDVHARLHDAKLGAPRVGAGRTMVIDYSSPNIAKRMHIGHLRSTIIGSALDRLHRFLGWTVVADNHVGDWGTPFGMLIVAWHEWRDERAFGIDAVGELQRLYQLFKERAKSDPSLDDRARLETAKLQQGNADNRDLWRTFCEASLREFQAIYARLGVKFDVFLGESFYEPRLPSLVAELVDRGIAVESNGALIVPFTAEDGKNLENSPLLIRKRDGAWLYGTTDLATIEHRIQTWNPELMIYLVDGRQQLHFQQVFAAARKIGWNRTYVHAWFGVLTLPGGAIASTREGQVLNLADVLDTAAARAREVVDARSPELPEAERERVAEAIGVGALKYFDLSQNPQSDIAFEWDRALAMEGNTAPYLMYAHARCRSILRKAHTAGLHAGPILVEHAAERALALEIARTPESIVNAAAAFRPNVLADQLYQLTQSFSRFWEQCRVLGDDVPAETASSRLSLVAATAHAIAAGLGILGVEAPERL
jgi:arginyl-tRNA synthetase